MIFDCSRLPETLKRGTDALKENGFLTLGSDGIAVEALLGTQIVVEKSEGRILITYDTVPHFYMALARSIGMQNGIHRIDQNAKYLGFMLDCSRNAVAKPDMVKRLICMLVTAGYNYLELYMEDTYELQGEPYFGYMRGRYRAEELREIISFADIFQFEIVPCIQTLGHLERLFTWAVYRDFLDTPDILLTKDERTYQLIRECLKFCREVFHTKRINIGTDEAASLGRGKYIDRFGYEPKHEIYLRHLKKVFQICKEEGFEPEFWADAFYNTESTKEEIAEIFDGSQMPIYWEYSLTTKEPHYEKMTALKEYAGKVKYAGGCWKWIGYAPDNAYSDSVHRAALEAAMECGGIDDFLITAWGDNGEECSVYAIIPSMWYVADRLYPCETDLEKTIEELTGYTDAEWRYCDELNHAIPDVKRVSSTAKNLLHNDFLIGLMDCNTPDCAKERYRQMSERFASLAEHDSQFSYIFKAYAALSLVLSKKATYGKRLYKAYQEKDPNMLRKFLDELAEIKVDLKDFYDRLRELWLKENKSFGFEVLDVRIGGLIARADTVAIILNDYLNGQTDKIYELEEVRLEYNNGQNLKGNDRYALYHNIWTTTYSANVI